MAKNKLDRFAELKRMAHVVEFGFHDLRKGQSPLRGKWRTAFFKNGNPLVLELGCGKGEYTIALAEKYPGKNFIGVDVKGARLHRGASNALEKNLNNAAFLRTRIDFINALFDEQEVDEIWITFPDPQIEKGRKRLTSPRFLQRYAHLLKPGGIIHLKTDSVLLHEYTKSVIAEEEHELIDASADIYSEPSKHDPLLTAIKTTYEKMFLEKGLKITYVSFRLKKDYAKDVTVFPLDFSGTEN
ncbi:MAG TPA: tRNA (guanosine(46)-N7)-methyltransferase TrmB [Bacteroidia bacterium]|nr:tRNA (guanosine(46)-N7)-methyltransferase TrmB [Bacteroidia bacterium]